MTALDELRQHSAYARAYGRLGWPVVPCHSWTGTGCSCGHADCRSPAKHPRTAHGLKEASTDQAAISAWWLRWPDANIAVITGPASGLLVVDVDMPDGELSLAEAERRWGPLPETALQITGGGGYQLFFAYPDGEALRNSAGRLGPMLDTRAAGGYVIAPPSLHRSGRRYAWAEGRGPREMPPVELPEAWVEALRPPRVEPRPELKADAIDSEWGRRPWYSRAALDHACCAIRDAPDRQQHATLYREAAGIGGLIGSGHMPKALARRLLVDAGMRMKNHRAERWTEAQVEAEIDAGLAAGIASPRVPPEGRP